MGLHPAHEAVLLERLERDRAEHFLARDAHLRRHVVEEGRAGEEPVLVPGQGEAPTVDNEVGALLAGATPLRADEDFQAASLVFINSPSNPTGRVAGVEELRRIVAWARETGAIIASDEFSVRRGATAALGVNDYDFGRTTGKMVGKILDGTPVNQVKPEVMNQLTLYVSPKHAQAQGLTLNPELLKGAINVDTTPERKIDK